MRGLDRKFNLIVKRINLLILKNCKKSLIAVLNGVIFDNESEKESYCKILKSKNLHKFFKLVKIYID